MRKTLIIIVSVIVGAIIGTVVLVFGVLPTFEDECAGDECTQTDSPTLVPVPLPTRMPTREKAYKPVLYLYPQEERQLAVTLDVEGELGTVYPAPERQVQTEEGTRASWTISAAPDGTLTDESGQTYRYLYWEGKDNVEYDFSQGACVAGEDTAAFLEDALSQLGLTRREANEFIVYWLPQMEENPYNLIAFQSDAYTEAARLAITPTPDTVLRVFMAWKPLEEPVELPPQELAGPERSGFTVVEWGGCQVK